MTHAINFNGSVGNVNIVEGNRNTFQQNIGNSAVSLETGKKPPAKDSRKTVSSHCVFDELPLRERPEDGQENPAAQTRDFFISYNNGRDGAAAAWIAQTLRENGYTVYFQADDCKAGMNFPQWIAKAIGHSRGFIAVWSRAYEKAPFCQDELSAAYLKSRKNSGYRFLLTRVENEPIENDLFKPFVRVDLLSDDDSNRAVLLSAVKQV